MPLAKEAKGLGAVEGEIGETSSASILNVGGVRALRLLLDESDKSAFPGTFSVPKGLGAAMEARREERWAKDGFANGETQSCCEPEVGLMGVSW